MLQMRCECVCHKALCKQCAEARGCEPSGAYTFHVAPEWHSGSAPRLVFPLKPAVNLVSLFSPTWQSFCITGAGWNKRASAFPLDYVAQMPALGSLSLSVLSVALQFLAASSQLSAQPAHVTQQPWTKVCVPFSDDAVASADLTEQEQSILPDLCYHPDLIPHVFQSEEDRGIPPGVDCTPVEWCVSDSHTVTCLQCFLWK